MKIDLTCPIEITKTEVLADDRGRCRGYIDIVNLSEHPIRRIEGRAIWLSDIGGELTGLDVVFEGMRLIPHGHAQLTVAGEIPAASDIRLNPSEIAFSDFSESWTSEDSEIIEYDFTPEPPGPARDKLRGIVGADAVCYPEMRGNDWLCVCGRLNSDDAHVCARCMRGRERVFAVLRGEGEGLPVGEWDRFASRLERRERLSAKHEEMRLISARARHRKRERRTKLFVGVVVGLIVISALLLIGILLGYIVF